jgi:hypothetical protein
MSKNIKKATGNMMAERKKAYRQIAASAARLSMELKKSNPDNIKLLDLWQDISYLKDWLQVEDI